MSVSVQSAAFDIGSEMAELTKNLHGIGAVASFVGLVRDMHEVDGASASTSASVEAMTLEHYPGMTERALEEIVAAAKGRWDLIAVRVIHRYGRLAPGEGIVLVIVASAHRGEAFAACEFIMDFLKTRAPFWKKEESTEGGRWVAARDEDESATARWMDRR
ncbi:MAG: molybdenum cofactor biosynthesis protein MoaE [Sterolibacterium sp.]